MTYLKMIALSVLLIVMVSPASDVRAQNSGSVKAEGSKRLTDEEIIREATDMLRRAWRGSEGSASAAGGLTRLLKDNPDSSTTPILHALLDGLREKQAAHSFAVAMFYLNKRAKGTLRLKGAESRLRDIANRYPRYSRMDDVLYHLSLIEFESGRRSDAIATLERFITEFKDISPRSKDAFANLAAYKAIK